MDRQRTRRVANLVNLSTPLGLGLARVGGATVRPGPYGLRLAHGWRFGFPRAAAFTVGDVILTKHPDGYLQARPALVRHESRHAGQWACWLGLPFLIGYGVAVGWSYLRTGTPALGNPFEQRAGLADGGYVRRERA